MGPDIVVVADQGGFVGAFASKADAIEALRPYPHVPRVFLAFPWVESPVTSAPPPAGKSEQELADEPADEPADTPDDGSAETLVSGVEELDDAAAAAEEAAAAAKEAAAAAKEAAAVAAEAAKETAKETAAAAAATALEPGEHLVWCVPYLHNNAVAFVSNCRATAEKVRDSLHQLGLVPDDEVDYWESVVGQITASAQRRLTELQHFADDKKAMVKFIDFASRDEHAEPARIDIAKDIIEVE